VFFCANSTSFHQTSTVSSQNKCADLDVYMEWRGVTGVRVDVCYANKGSLVVDIIGGAGF
jgi:hypothetical protein